MYVKSEEEAGGAPRVRIHNHFYWGFVSKEIVVQIFCCLNFELHRQLVIPIRNKQNSRAMLSDRGRTGMEGVVGSGGAGRRLLNERHALVFRLD